MAARKELKLDASEMKPLAVGLGACLASDRITVDGEKVGYFYRERPDNKMDSGWRFFAGDESDHYCRQQNRFELYDINTIANYDPDIVPLLETRWPCAFTRDDSGAFVEEPFESPED